MAWIQLHITSTREHAALAVLLLETLGALSVTLTDAGDDPLFEPPLGATPLWHTTRICGLFPADKDPAALQAAVARAAGHLGSPVVATLECELLQDQEWERAWLERFRPMRFGERLWICPSAFEVQEPGAVVVRLDPGLAFGSGTHPTTALCLRWLDGARLAGRRVIDFGCGSGILAVAAAKLGAAEVIALDHDPQALTATARNAEANGVAGVVRVHAGAPETLKPAEVVVANILANVLVDLADTLAALLAPGGTLVLSGILEEQTKEVAAAFRRHLELEPPEVDQDWVRMVGHV